VRDWYIADSSFACATKETCFFQWSAVQAVICCALTLVVFISTREALAEARVMYGTVPLSVQSLRPAGADLVTVQVLGEAFLVAERDAGKRVALRLLSSPNSEIASELIKTLAEQASILGDSEVLQSALKLMTGDADRSEFDSEAAWAKIVEAEVGQIALVQALAAHSEAMPAKRLCAALSVLQQRPVRTPGANELAHSKAQVCVNAAVLRAFEHVYSGRDLQEGIRIIETASAAYGPPQKLLSELRLLVDTLRSLNESILASNLDSFGSSLKSLRAQGVSYNFEPESLNPNNLIEIFMRDSNGRGAYAAALQGLSLLDFERRTPAIHQYILAALAGVAPQDALKAFSPEVHAIVGQFAAKDDQIAKYYVLMLERCVSGLAKDGRLVEAQELLTKAQSVDVSVRDRFKGGAEFLAARLFDARDVSGAQQILKSFVSQPSFSIRLRQWLASLGLTLSLALVIIGIAMLAVFILSRKRRAKSVEADKQKAEAIRKSASSMQPPPVEEKGPRYSPEYIEALKIFGLGVEASLAEIKNAYRQAVKEHHPDAKHNPTAADNDYFISLTTAYERLLKLHEREGKAAS
jgi:DnaJ-domain-containing protein 1